MISTLVTVSQRCCIHRISVLLFTGEEKQLIREIFSNSIYGLSEDDKKLPSVSCILPYLERGIGIHHSGLLPILKEVIEMMFGEGLIKVNIM